MLTLLSKTDVYRAFLTYCYGSTIRYADDFNTIFSDRRNINIFSGFILDGFRVFGNLAIRICQISFLGSVRLCYFNLCAADRSTIYFVNNFDCKCTAFNQIYFGDMGGLTSLCYRNRFGISGRNIVSVRYFGYGYFITSDWSFMFSRSSFGILFNLSVFIRCIVLGTSIRLLNGYFGTLYGISGNFILNLNC